MSDSGETAKYKWTPESSSLLVSVWSDRQVQKQLEYAPKPQLIWESVARYLKKKGYNVSGKQCRSRMKQVLVCYREAKRAGTRAGVEQYYESIDRVLKTKRLEENNLDGIDTVDAAINVRSPPKDMKTNKNLQMRHKIQEPVQSMYRTEALSPTWIPTRENEYPDSPESSETILARPRSVFSPTKDVAINTNEQLTQVVGKPMQCNSCAVEEPVCAKYKQNLVGNFNYGGEMPFQNSVQNVQNQIIQETMQQYQNLHQNALWGQQNMVANNLGIQQNLHNLRQCLNTQGVNAPMQPNVMPVQNMNFENLVQHRNQLQQNVPLNHAVPQEPRKIVFSHNLAATYKQYPDTLPRMTHATNTQQTGSSSPDYSPDVSQNLNDAFCQSAKNEHKARNLNETYNQQSQGTNTLFIPNSEVSVVTNNATCNDESLLMDMLLESPIPSDSDNKSKEMAVNTEESPHAPFRKKKAQKLEQLVLSAISSQNEVVNKILAAQNDMVSKFIDIDRDRQNRLENRLDDLLKVVHATVLNKSPGSDNDVPSPPPEPTIRSLAPPPRPGAVPPKLDLVPPKPCRVPCTIPNSNVELINQNPISTRPGIVSPIMSPIKKPGTIWSKLGPVSQSPFVKAQQRLGIHAISGTECRTQSSAERRIAREMGKMYVDTVTLIFETGKFLEMERLVEEKIENARREQSLGQSFNARRRLFSQREPTPIMILTAAFLETESRASAENLEPYSGLDSQDRRYKKDLEDELLSGRGESYDRLRRLNIQSDCVAGEPCETSTPAKFAVSSNNNEDPTGVPKQTIQQLAHLVMSSARWKDTAHSHQLITGPPDHLPPSNVGPRVRAQNDAIQRDTQSRPIETIRYAGHRNDEKPEYTQAVTNNNGILPKPKYPMGFTTAMIDNEVPKQKEYNDYSKKIGFADNIVQDRKQQNVRFMDEALLELHRMYLERTNAKQQEKNDSLPYVAGNGNTLPIQNRQMIERYIHEIMPRKQLKDKDKDSDSDNDEEFLDTTATMPNSVVPRRGSLTSTGTASTETAHSMLKFGKADNNCIIS